MIIITAYSCQHGWTFNSRTHKCYKFVHAAKTWTQANRECKRIAPTEGSGHKPIVKRHLASISSKAENDFVKGLIGTCLKCNAWLGGTKLGDGTWTWTDGSHWGYTSWSQSPVKEPNNSGGHEDSLVMWGYAGRGLWNDTPSRQLHSFVCQYLDMGQF